VKAQANPPNGSTGTATPKPQFVTAGEIAAVLGTCKKTIHNHAQAGLLPHHRIGAKLLFDVAEVLRHTRREASATYRAKPRGDSKNGKGSR
jgi:excisionase family DNA binding protein